MPSEALTVRLRAEADAVGVALTDQHTERLSRYLELIRRWKRPARLTAIADPGEAARLHIADSLLCLRAGIEPCSAVIDVGSGAGLPGIPLAIVRPDLHVTLLEAEKRKAAFLEMAVRELELAARIMARRAEDAGHDPATREQYEAAVARAVAPLRVLLELTMPFVRVGGKAVLLKGPRVLLELQAAGRAIGVLGGGGAKAIEASLSGGERRSIVVVQKFRPTPSAYPRRSGVPAKKPL